MSLRGRLERWLDGIWYGGAPVPRSLAALEPLYRRMAAPMARPSERPPVPVIVVGNLVAGGSGKTPVVIALVRLLAGQSHAVAVISRGYGGRGTRRPRRVGMDDRAAEVGDEALEIAAATAQPVWVARRRRAALQAAIESGAEVIVADDGLQHAALPRSLEICVIDARRGFGNGRQLPAGPLRQSRRRLESVDLVLLRCVAASTDTPIDTTIDTTIDPASEQLERLAPAAMRFEIRSGPVEPADPTAPELPEPPLAIDAVAGISDPIPFFEGLEARGYSVRRHRFADHQAIPERWLTRLAGPVVTTAKDLARMRPYCRNDLYVLPLQALLPAAAVDQVLAHVREFRA